VFKLILLGSILTFNLMAQDAVDPCVEKAKELEIQQAKCKDLSDKVLKKACKTKGKEIKKELKACKREAKKAKKAEVKESRAKAKKLTLDEKQMDKCRKIFIKAKGKADKKQLVPMRLLKKLEKNKCIQLES